jgi:hypothetical protein
MNYVGVDIHKKYSVLCALDERGRKLREGRVEGNAPSGFAQVGGDWGLIFTFDIWIVVFQGDFAWRDPYELNLKARFTI